MQVELALNSALLLQSPQCWDCRPASLCLGWLMEGKENALFLASEACIYDLPEDLESYIQLPPSVSRDHIS